MHVKIKFFPGLSVILALVVLASLVQAQDDSWLEQRARLQVEIDRHVQAEVNREVKPEEVALAHGLSWPVPSARKTLDLVFAEADARLREAVEKEYPTRLQEEIRQDALRLYGYCKVGDEVSIRTIGKMGHAITGRLQAVTPGRVQIANRWLTAVDLDSDTMARFFPDLAREVQKKYVDREMRRLNLRVDEFSRQFRRRNFPDILRQNGYRPLEELDGSEYLNPVNWISHSEWFADCLFAARRAREQELRPAITEEVFTENGFYYDGETRAWLPRDRRSNPNGGRSPGAGRRPASEEGVVDKLKRLFR